MRRFQGRSYVLGGDVIYSESEFQELESAYHEVCRELDEAKLELIPLSKKIKLMAGVLYTRQRLNNKFINGFKGEIRFLLDASGASSSAIETLASASLAVRRETIARKKAQHVEVHMDTVDGFLVKNNENLIVLNVDDFHNIHEYRRSDTTTTHDIGHFVTILLKALPEMASVPYKNPNQEKSIHNKKGIDSDIIVENAHLLFFSSLWLSYTGRKGAFANLESSQETYDERVERLLVHNYDDRIEQRRVDRSIVDTKLVDLKEGSLHTTIEYVDALRVLIDIPEAETYMKTQVLIAPMDYPEQLNIRRAVTRRIKFGDSSGIPEQILHVVPMIGPLHVSLNSCEMVFLLNYQFFDLLFHGIFGNNKVLAQKPKPYKINILLELAYQGWSKIRSIVIRKFECSKDPEPRYLINLLDNIVPLVLDFYPIIFRSGNWQAYLEAMFRV
ncbi:hypothetical protein C2G38_2292038 [Gigaspora rosea]|uniref:Uncharacterized protein n=1 Tax=Gigaspora rosea TaxID=44941 RepID=A0A397TZ86_9GLOM|nr:hypothetical protein C2G38_2292038 [Gigaspora rosea]